MPDDTKELRELCRFALRLAREAGEVALGHFQRVATEYKADGTEVTEADRRAEELIRETIEREHPGAAILGEEFGGGKEPVPGDQWIVDPIDGTSSFVLGLPLFGTLIALLRKGEPVLGVVHLPGMGETLHAVRGGGCWYERGGGAPQRVRCEPVKRIGDAYASTTSVHASELQPVGGAPAYLLEPIARQARKYRPVCDCVQHALVCLGRLHLAIDPLMAPWDSAALVPCVLEAGGSVATLSGEMRGAVFGGSLVSAASGELLSEALALIRP